MARRRKAGFEALDAILNARDLGLVDDRNASARGSERGAQQFRRLRAALHVIARDVRDDFALLRAVRDVGREDGHVRVVRLDDRATDRLRIVRREHDRGDLLRNEIFDLTLLLRIVATRIDDDDGVPVFRGLRLHAGFHIFIELRFAILDGDADRFRSARGRTRVARRGRRRGRCIGTPTARGERERERGGGDEACRNEQRGTSAAVHASRGWGSPASARERSATISSARSMPTEIRTVPSPTPSARRTSPGSGRCELTAG